MMLHSRIKELEEVVGKARQKIVAATDRAEASDNAYRAKDLELILEVRDLRDKYRADIDELLRKAELWQEEVTRLRPLVMRAMYRLGVVDD
jgi:DNA repair ATPase RecN